MEQRIGVLRMPDGLKLRKPIPNDCTIKHALKTLLDFDDEQVLRFVLMTRHVGGLTLAQALLDPNFPEVQRR